ncbi:4'-phosphopantetheinyl transferase superfamily protein [Roseovarius sp. M141]|uniref:4'-phosphopantetheinyl transferase family protein n=1 Tax=Roseovarius sp. M141 TaxID=2583806 RepID=UPI0020CB961E|nr:4'-phosphopantetheinyl transferase superfamily protein [Roseovarius sp. M141]
MQEGVVHLVWCRTSDTHDSLESALLPILDEDERKRFDRFCFATDQKSFLVGHVLARTMLAAISGRSPETWAFRLGPHGKPEPVIHPGEPDLRMNLSHCKGLAMVGVTVSRNIGVDVEAANRPHALEVADKFFAAEEIRQIEEAREAGCPHAATSIWTLKEALLKASGTGLSVPLDSFAVGLSPPRLIHEGHLGTADRWSLFQFPISEDVLAAVAVERAPGCGAPAMHRLEVTVHTLSDLAARPSRFKDLGVC